MSGLASSALASMSSSVSFGGRPPVRPARRAAARPAWVRFRIILRSGRSVADVRGFDGAFDRAEAAATSIDPGFYSAKRAPALRNFRQKHRHHPLLRPTALIVLRPMFLRDTALGPAVGRSVRRLAAFNTVWHLHKNDLPLPRAYKGAHHRFHQPVKFLAAVVPLRRCQPVRRRINECWRELIGRI
jgi:hypothetical protein